MKTEEIVYELRKIDRNLKFISQLIVFSVFGQVAIICGLLEQYLPALGAAILGTLLSFAVGKLWPE